MDPARQATEFFSRPCRYFFRSLLSQGIDHSSALAGRFFIITKTASKETRHKAI